MVEQKFVQWYPKLTISLIHIPKPHQNNGVPRFGSEHCNTGRKCRSHIIYLLFSLISSRISCISGKTKWGIIKPQDPWNLILEVSLLHELPRNPYAYWTKLPPISPPSRPFHPLLVLPSTICTHLKLLYEEIFSILCIYKTLSDTYWLINLCLLTYWLSKIKLPVFPVYIWLEFHLQFNSLLPVPNIMIF